MITKDRKAMFAALSEYFGEELTSHNQLDASKWGRAASAVQMQELCWSSEPSALLNGVKGSKLQPM